MDATYSSETLEREAPFFVNPAAKDGAACPRHRPTSITVHFLNRLMNSFLLLSNETMSPPYKHHPPSRDDQTGSKKHSDDASTVHLSSLSPQRNRRRKLPFELRLAIENRAGQFEYHKAIEQKRPIGSGETASAHRCLHHKRMKIPGAAWLIENTES